MNLLNSWRSLTRPSNDLSVQRSRVTRPRRTSSRMSGSGFFRSLDRGSIIEDPEAWLYRSARNRVIDTYRKIQPLNLNEIEAESFQDDESPEDEVYREEFFDQLEAALNELPGKQRVVFMRNEIEGVTLREIAEEENENLKTIISRKRYAVTRLRAALGDYYEEFLGE